MQTILAVDDELSVRESYRMIFSDQYRVLVEGDAPSALNLLREKHVDLVLLDLSMPNMTGQEFLAAMDARGDTTPVIVVTASNTVEAAVAAMKSGAREFVIKPFDTVNIMNLVDRSMEEIRGKQELGVLREQGIAGFEHIIGEAPSLLEALAKAQQAMQVDSTVLITGETGTGKDVLARAIHYGGKRKTKSFVPISCCAIPEALVESELFGHKKGAFTGALDNRVGKMQVADGGSLFLDEIGEMPMDAQAKLLRVLQDGSFYPVGDTRQVVVDVRFICATNRNFSDAIADKLFREDLFYRINVLPIYVPPLRRRREDIPQLVAHFAAKHGPRVNAQAEDFAPRALARLAAYNWPGNIRELENTIERILVCNSGEKYIRPEHLDGMLPETKALHEDTSADALAEYEGLSLQDATARIERRLIQQALERCSNVQSRAAEELGTTRRILKYKMDQLNILTPDEHQSAAG